MSVTNIPLAEQLEDTLPSKRTQLTAAPTNRLLETHSFRPAPNGNTSIFKVTPSVVHFSGFQVGQKHTIHLQLLNGGAQRARYHVIQPTTEFFKLTYMKKEFLVPGLAEDIEIEFTPTEWRYYYDCIRFHCPNEDNILIPIHAYPVVSELALPQFIDMGTCPLSETRVKRIPLSCNVPIDFEFKVNIIQSNPFFKVAPEYGTIPANASTEIIVSFTPLNYITTTMTFEVLLSQFNSKPMRCSVSGSSTPGLVAAKHVRELTQQLADTTIGNSDQTYITSATTARKPPQQTRRLPSKATATSTSMAVTSFSATANQRAITQQSVQVIDGIIIPSNIATVRDVNKILNQPALDGLNAVCVLDSKNARDNIRAKDGESGNKAINTMSNDAQPLSREARADAFLKQLRDLGARVGKGDPGMTNETREEILAKRREAELVYLAAQGIGTSVEASATERHEVVYDNVPTRTFRRIPQASSDNAAAPPSSSSLVIANAGSMVFAPDMHVEWQRRSESLTRFIQAARKVIVRLRVARRYNDLQRTLTQQPAARTSSARLIRRLDQRTSVASIVSDGSFDASVASDFDTTLPISKRTLIPFKFPVYTLPATIKHSVARVRVNDCVSAWPPAELPLSQLEIAQQSKVLGYKAVSDADATIYIAPISLAKTAEPLVPTDSADANADASAEAMEQLARDIGVSLPDAIRNNKPHYPQGHIFHPLPDSFRRIAPLPHAETDVDHFLQPLTLPFCYPTPELKDTTVANPPTALDVIPELVDWHAEHYRSLVSAQHVPNTSHYWLPRLSQPFPSLSTEVPTVLPCLPEDDQAHIDPDNDEVASEVVTTLTMETALAGFPAIPTVRRRSSYHDDSASNNVCDGALWGDRVTLLNSYVDQHVDQIGQQLRSSLHQLAADIQSDALREKFVNLI